MAGEFLTSLGNFVTSDVGAGLLGAGLGYGAASLAGANPEQAALAGLGGGLLGYGAGSYLTQGSAPVTTQAIDAAGNKTVQQVPAWLNNTNQMMGLLGKGAETYGNIQSGMSQSNLANQQIGLLGMQNALALNEYNRQKQREQATQEALSGGFQQSRLANYYSA